MGGIPDQTRIILIPEDQRASREYDISRGMILGLGTMLGLLALLTVVVLASFSHQSYRLWRAEREVAQLEGAGRSLAEFQELEAELESVRSLQERLLTMLGVRPTPQVAGQDSLARWVNLSQSATTADALTRAADLIMTPAPNLWPVSGHVTREFSEGDIPAGLRPHRAIDIAGPVDSPVRAAGGGVVRKARWDDYLGNMVEIQHGFGYVTVYGHCSRLAVGEGEAVARHQLIGYLGGTGVSSAPHLHFEIWQEGEAVDPRTVIPGDPPR